MLRYRFNIERKVGNTSLDRSRRTQSKTKIVYELRIGTYCYSGKHRVLLLKLPNDWLRFFFNFDITLL